MRFGLTFRTALASVLLGVLVVGGFGLMTFAVLELRAAATASWPAPTTTSSSRSTRTSW